MEQKKPKVYFENLDGLRTLAFLIVFFSHSIIYFVQSLGREHPLLGRFLMIFCFGENGISIFFVLSGFLITYLLLLEKKQKGKINIGFFYIRRILRIWPLYYVIIFIALVIYPLYRTYIGKPVYHPYHPYFYWIFLSNLDVITSTRMAQTTPMVSVYYEGITWSVAIEEQFYLLWPLLLTAISAKFYKYIFLVIIGISIFFRALHTGNWEVYYFHSLSVCGDLALGGLCAYCLLTYDRFEQIFRSLKWITIIGVYILGIAFLMFEDILFHNLAAAIFPRLLRTIFFAFIIMEQSYSKGSFYKFSKNKFFTNCGKYTYGLYLWHLAPVFLIEAILTRFDLNYKTNLAIALTYTITAFGFSFLMSYISYNFFEKRFLALKDKFQIIRKKYTLVH